MRRTLVLNNGDLCWNKKEKILLHILSLHILLFKQYCTMNKDVCAVLYSRQTNYMLIKQNPYILANFVIDVRYSYDIVTLITILFFFFLRMSVLFMFSQSTKRHGISLPEHFCKTLCDSYILFIYCSSNKATAPNT